jgi:hypothetical protein
MSIHRMLYNYRQQNGCSAAQQQLAAHLCLAFLQIY